MVLLSMYERERDWPRLTWEEHGEKVFQVAKSVVTVVVLGARAQPAGLVRSEAASNHPVMTWVLVLGRVGLVWPWTEAE